MWQQIVSVFESYAVVGALIFCVAAGVGQALHAVKKWAMDKDVECLMDWFFKDKKRTVAAMLGNAGGMLVFIQTGVLGELLQLGPSGIEALILFGFMNGFSTDSALNRGVKSLNDADSTMPPKP